MVFVADYLGGGGAGVKDDTVVLGYGGYLLDGGQDDVRIVADGPGLEVDVAGRASFAEGCEQYSALPGGGPGVLSCAGRGRHVPLWCSVSAWS